MHADPALACTLQLKELGQGGRLVWIAPSGGRDRPDADGNWAPDKFDPSAVELMRHLAAKSGKPAHFWPFAMLSWRVMPPPTQKEKALGERRLTHFSATGQPSHLITDCTA